MIRSMQNARPKIKQNTTNDMKNAPPSMNLVLSTWCIPSSATSSVSSMSSTTVASSFASSTFSVACSAASVASAASTTAQTTTELTTVITETTVTETVAATEAVIETNGCASAYEAAQAYYNAYLSGSSDGIYELFSQEEIEGFHRFVDNSGMLGGEKSAKAFRKTEVIKAVQASIDNIHDFMNRYSDGSSQQWNYTLKESDLKPLSAEELSEFNLSLGTGFTSAVECGFVYYTDGVDEHRFVGNDCSLLEKNGKWFVSYSTYISSELISYIDIF
mgnify:CR=1 FL=1